MSDQPVKSARPRFRYSVIHVDNADGLIKQMQKKAKSLGLPERTPVTQLARMAIMVWLKS